MTIKLEQILRSHPGTASLPFLQNGAGTSGTFARPGVPGYGTQSPVNPSPNLAAQFWSEKTVLAFAMVVLDM